MIFPVNIISIEVNGGGAIHELKRSIDNNIPIIMLYSNADNIVIYEENGMMLENCYRKNSDTIKVIARSIYGHYPHGLDDLSPIVAFVEEHFAPA